MNKSANNFLKCLHSILGNFTLESIVKWNPEGSRFLIQDLKDFESIILSTYFSDLTMKAFKKKLKSYSFTKTITENLLVYYHPNFQRDKPCLLKKISCINEIPSRKKNNASDSMVLKIQLLESTHIRMEETMANLEKKYQKIIDLNKFVLRELKDSFNVDQEEFKQAIKHSNVMNKSQ
jgi:HSF-type DNA-binding